MSRRSRSVGAVAPVITAVIPQECVSRAIVGAKHGAYMRAGDHPVKFTDSIVVSPVAVDVLQREIADNERDGGEGSLVVRYCIGSWEEVLTDALHPTDQEEALSKEFRGKSKTWARVMFFIIEGQGDGFIDVAKMPEMDFVFARPTQSEIELFKTKPVWMLRQLFPEVGFLEGVMLTSIADGRLPEVKRELPPIIYKKPPQSAELLESVRLTDDKLAKASGWFACVKDEPRAVGVGHGALAEAADPQVLARQQGTLPQLRFKCTMAGAAFADAVLPPV